jgi:hypothetical protein
VLGRRRARARRAITGGGGLAAAMARAARCGARGGAGRLYTRLGRPVGDALVTAGDAAVLRRVGSRAYGGDAADGPLVRGARARTAARTPRRLGTVRIGARVPRDAAWRGRRGLGRRGHGCRGKTGGGGTVALGARTTSRMARSGSGCVAGAIFDSIFLKIFQQNCAK